jgi:hypothetical protein
MDISLEFFNRIAALRTLMGFGRPAGLGRYRQFANLLSTSDAWLEAVIEES